MLWQTGKGIYNHVISLAPNLSACSSVEHTVPVSGIKVCVKKRRIHSGYYMRAFFTEVYLINNSIIK